MRRLVLLPVTALLAMTAFADDLLECLSPDAKVLMLQSQGQRPPVFTSVLPAELAPLKLPREFTWVGAAERTQGRLDATTNVSQVTAAWRSTQPLEAARAAVVAAMTASGWTVQPAMNSMMVFSASSNPPQQTACREGKPVNVTVSAMEGVSYALVAIQRGNSGNISICNQPVRIDPLASSGMDKIAPKLELPVDPATGASARQQNGSSGGFGGGVLRSQVQFSVTDSIGNVASHFAKQMAAQGWSSDATWSGKATAGSTWLRKSDAKTEFQGTVSVAALDEGQYLATLRVMQVQ
jgi:hypothetical protein